MTTYCFFRDQLTIDDSLPDQLATLAITRGRATLLCSVLRPASSTACRGGFDYLIMADSLSTTPVVQTALGTGRSVSIYAESITTPLQVTPGHRRGSWFCGRGGPGRRACHPRRQAPDSARR